MPFSSRVCGLGGVVEIVGIKGTMHGMEYRETVDGSQRGEEIRVTNYNPLIRTE